jgi:hypothetical protein
MTLPAPAFVCVNEQREDASRMSCKLRTFFTWDKVMMVQKQREQPQSESQTVKLIHTCIGLPHGYVARGKTCPNARRLQIRFAANIDQSRQLLRKNLSPSKNFTCTQVH